MPNDLSNLPNENPTDTLHLSLGGHDVVLTPSKLERWLSTAERVDLMKQPDSGEVDIATQEQDSFLATQFISRFGFKKPSDLIMFLKSEGGKSTLAEIGEQLAIIAAIEEDREFQLREQQQAMKMISNLMLYMIYQKEQKDHVLRDLMQAEIEKLLNKNEPTGLIAIPQDTSYVNTDNLISHYNKSAKLLEDRLDDRIKASKALEVEIQALQQQQEALTQKYHLFETGIKEVENLHKFLGIAPHEKPTIEHMESKIAQMKLDIDAIAKSVHQDLENGYDEAAREKLQFANCMNAQIGMLKDMIEVAKNKKVLFKADGEKAHKFEDAEFIIPADKAEKFQQKMEGMKLVKSGAQYLLMDKDQDPENLTEEQRALAYEAGQQAFQDLELRPEEIMNVKNLIDHNKTLEHAEHAEKMEHISAKSKQMEEEIGILTRQLTDIIDAREQAEASLKQQLGPNAKLAPHAPQPPSSPMTPVGETPQFNPSPKPGHPTQGVGSALTHTYKHMLMQMKDAVSQHALTVMRKGLTPFEMEMRPGVSSILETLNSLKPGKPIPPSAMETLMKGLEALGNDLRKTPNLGMKEPPKPEERTYPTPFSTSPFK